MIYTIAVPILKIRTEAKELNLVKVTWVNKWQDWLEYNMTIRASLVTQMIKNLLAMQET